MPGANCSIYGCSTSRNTPGVAIFRITRGTDEFSKKWREALVNAVTKDRVINPSLKKQVEDMNLHICQRHFTEDLYDFSKKLMWLTNFLCFAEYSR